jgi:hypothetical protein
LFAFRGAFWSGSMALAARSTTQDLPAVLASAFALDFFDREARRVAGISGEEFIARYDAGEFHDFDDDPRGRELSYLILLIPFGRKHT